jgi:hypothetical protein
MKYCQDSMLGFALYEESHEDLFILQYQALMFMSSFLLVSML